MSAPAMTPRPTQPGRPTRPVPRAAPARPDRARTGSSRSGGTSRTVPRTGSTARSPRAGGAAGAARGAAAPTVGATALALQPGLPTGSPQAAGRTRMRVLERPRTAGRRVGFAVTCTAMLGALMLGLLLLNVAISGNAFTLAELQSQRSLLVDQQQALEHELLLRGSPSALAQQARGLGMVPAPQVLVLAPDGTGAPPAPPAP